jgi:hypothetical protein
MALWHVCTQSLNITEDLRQASVQKVSFSQLHRLGWKIFHTDSISWYEQTGGHKIHVYSNYEQKQAIIPIRCTACQFVLG